MAARPFCALALVVAAGVGSAQAAPAPAGVPGAQPATAAPAVAASVAAASVAAASVAAASVAGATADPVIEPPALGGVEANAPRRAYDSRTSAPLRAGETRRVKVRPDADPASWTGAWVNVTVTGATAPGYLTVWSGDGDRPTASTSNFTAGRTVPNVATVALTPTGEIAVHNGSTGTTHVIVDVLARVGDGAAVAPGSMRPVTPFRALDTRLTKVKVPAGGQVDVTVAGRDGVPLTAAGVLLNVTAVSPTTAGWATVSSPAEPRPGTSAANWVAGETRATTVMSRIDGGQVRLFNGGRSATDVLVDVTGWVVPGSTAQRPTAVTLTTPKRLVDTRTFGIVGPSGYLDIPQGQPSLHYPIYSVTTTGATAEGYLSFVGQSSSVTNYRAGGATTSFTVAGSNAMGPWLRLMNSSSASVQVVVDLVGWVGPDVWVAGTTRSESGQNLGNISVALAAPSTTPGRFDYPVVPRQSLSDGTWTVFTGTTKPSPVCAVQPRPSGGADLTYAPTCLGGGPTATPQTYSFPVGSRARGIDLVLPRAGAVVATILPPSSQLLAPYVLVRHLETRRQFAVQLSEFTDGRVVVDGLAEGDYLVLQYDLRENHEYQWVGGVHAGALVTTEQLLSFGATTVHVTPGARTDLGTRTPPVGGRIKATTKRLGKLTARAYSEDGRPQFAHPLSSTKPFEAGGLRPGTYYLCFGPEGPPLSCDPQEDGVGPITVTAGQTTTVEVP